MGKDRRNIVTKDPLDREIKLLVTFVLIAFVIGGLLPFIPHFIGGLIQYADAAQFYIKPDTRVQLQHTGTGATCPVITGPASATSAVGGTKAFQHFDDGSASGCHFNTYIIEESMFPQEWADLIANITGSGPAGGLRIVINLDEADTDSLWNCEMWSLDDPNTATDEDLVDPRINVTKAYDAIRDNLNRLGTDTIPTWDRCRASVTQGSQSKPVDEQKYWESQLVNQTWFGWVTSGAGFLRDTTGDREAFLDDIFLKFSAPAPVNHTNNWWQMQEHPMYSGSYPVISDGFFGIDGTTFTMDTGTTNTDRGQVVIFKQFNKTEFNSTGGYGDIIYSSQFGGDGLHGWSADYAIGQSFTTTQSETVSSIDFNTSWRSGCTALTGGEIIPFIYSTSESTFYVNGTDQMGAGLNVTGVVGYGPSTQHWVLDNPITIPAGNYVAGHLLDSVTGGGGGCFMDWGADLVSNGNQPGTSQLDTNWKTGVTFAEYSSTWDLGILVNGIAYPDIRVQGGIISLGSSDDVHLHVEVRDGNFQAGQTEGDNVIDSTNLKTISGLGDGSDGLAYFERNQFMTFRDDNYDPFYSLGVYDLEDPTLGTVDPFDISFSPNYSNSTSDIITVFVAVQDNSTTGRMIANITSIELEDNILYNFTDINDFIFYEPDCDTGMATTDETQTPSVTDNDNNCGLDYSNGLTKINNETAGTITANVLPTPPNVENVTASQSNSIYLDWDHDLVNVTGFRIYRTSTEPQDTEPYIDGLPSGLTTVATCSDGTSGNAQNNCGQGGSAFGMDLAGKMVADMTWSLKNSNGSATTPSNAVIKGVIFNNMVDTGTDFTTVNNSTESYSTINVPTTLTDFTFTFRPPINSTDNNDGVGLTIDNWTPTYDYQIQAKKSALYTPKGDLFTENSGASSWNHGSEDFRIDVNLVNQTKLFYNPYVMNTGNLTTNWVDEGVEDGHTYFYRVVAINGDVEGETAFIANFTEPTRVGTIDDLQVFPIENNSIFMNWTEPIGDPDFYLIERADGDKARLGSDDFLVYHQDRLTVTPTTYGASTEFAFAQELTLTKRENITRIDQTISRASGVCAGSGVLRGGIWSTSGSVLYGSSNNTVSGCSLNDSFSSQLTNTESFFFDPPVQLDAGTYNFGANMTGTIDKSISVAKSTSSEVVGIAFSAPTDTFPYTFASLTPADWAMNVRKEAFSLIANVSASLTNYTDSSITTTNGTWQWREHDTGAFTPSFTFSGAGDVPTIVSTAGSIGNGYLFKTFDIDDIEGSDIRITWTAVTSLTTVLEVYDGAYDASSMTDFPNGAGRAVKGAGTLFSQSIVASQDTTTVIPSTSINYEDSTTGYVTFFFTPVDFSSGVAGTWTVREIDVTRVARSHFPPVSLTTTVSGTNNDYGFYEADKHTDYLMDGISYFYRVRGESDLGVAVNGSNIAYTKEPIQDDGNSEVVNESSDTWFYREVDPYSTITGGFGYDPAFDFTTLSGQVRITHASGVGTNSVGQGMLLKSFNKTEVFGSNFTVNWSAQRLDAGAGSTIFSLYDGAYNVENNPDFPLNSGIAAIGGGLLATTSIALGSDFTDTFTTLTNSSIDWDNSTEDYVTLVMTLDDPTHFTRFDMQINNVTITNLGTWQFDGEPTVRTKIENQFESHVEDYWDAGYYNSLFTATPPGEVTNLSALAINSTVFLDWTDATGADNYTVTRGILNASHTIIAQGVLTSQYTDIPAVNTNYTYSVWAVNSGGNGTADYSNSVITNDFPTAPQNLTVAMGIVIPDLEDAFLDWDAEVDNGTGDPSTGVPVFTYWIERRAGIGPYNFLANVTFPSLDFNNTEYEDESVISGANYTWRVRGVNALGFSPYSNTYSLIATPLTPPNAPTNLTATAVSGTQINVEWLAAIAGDPPTDYVLQQRHVGFTGFVTIATIPAPTLYYNATGLLPGNTYDYRVRADNGAGSSSYSNIDQEVTFDVPSAPQTLTATTINNTSIFIDWVQPASVGEGITKYNIERESPVGGGFVEIAELEGIISTNGQWQIRESNSSAGFSPIVLADQASDGRFNMTTTTGSIGSAWLFKVFDKDTIDSDPIIVDWQATGTPSGNPSEPTIAIYDGILDKTNNTQFYAGVTSNKPPVLFEYSGIGFTFPRETRTINSTDIPWINSTSNDITIAVRQADGHSTSGKNVLIGSIDAGGVLYNLTNADIDYIANPPFANEDNGTINAPNIDESVISPPDTEFTDIGLTQNTIYNYRVNAENFVGTSAYSNQDNDRTHGIPDAPINLSYTTNGVSTITVEWDSPVYTGGVPLTAYTIDQAQGIGGTFINAVPNDAVTPEDETFTGLLQSTNYIYRIAAKNQYGTGAYSANLTAGTFSGPSEPENFNAVFNSTFPYSVFLSWETPLDDGGEPIQGYIVQRKDLNNEYQLIANVSSTTFNFTDTSLLQQTVHTYRVAAYGSVGDFTADQPVTTVVPPEFGLFNITDFNVVGDVLYQQYDLIITDCFPACTLTQADIERNGIVESNYAVGQPIVIGDTLNFTTFFIIPTTGTQLVNTTAIVTNLGATGDNETGVVTTQLEFTFPTSLYFAHNRNSTFDGLNFTLIRHPVPWDAECFLRGGQPSSITVSVLGGLIQYETVPLSNPLSLTATLSLDNVGFFNSPPLFNVIPNRNAYMTCEDPVGTQILAFTSFGTGNGTLALTGFTDQLGTFLGVPIPFIFVIIFCAIWTGRSAPTGIIMLAVVIGAMGSLGYFDPLTGNPTGQGTSLYYFWGFIVFLTIVGAFLGKRFF